MIHTVLKILISIGMKLVTEAFVTEALLIIFEKLVKSSKNDLDDKIFEAVKKGVGR